MNMKRLMHTKYIQKGPLGNLKHGGNRSTQSSTREPKFLEETENLEFHRITNISGALGKPRGNNMKYLKYMKYIHKGPLGKLEYGENRSNQSSTGEPKLKMSGAPRKLGGNKEPGVPTYN